MEAAYEHPGKYWLRDHDQPRHLPYRNDGAICHPRDFGCHQAAPASAQSGGPRPRSSWASIPYPYFQPDPRTDFRCDPRRLCLWALDFESVDRAVLGRVRLLRSRERSAVLVAPYSSAADAGLHPYLPDALADGFDRDRALSRLPSGSAAQLKVGLISIPLSGLRR